MTYPLVVEVLSWRDEDSIVAENYHGFDIYEFTTDDFEIYDARKGEFIPGLYHSLSDAKKAIDSKISFLAAHVESECRSSKKS